MPLSPYRVLELGDEKAWLAGAILAELGARVIKVEPPDSAPAMAVNKESIAGLTRYAYNINKKSITLGIDTSTGADIFKRLVKTSDIVIESFAPGRMKTLKLDYARLSKVNPGIIVASITDFGQTGPYSKYNGSDIVLMAMGGFMSLCGDPDRAPLRISFPQAYLHAGLHTAAAILTALSYRNATGTGQYIDVSAQEAVTWLVNIERLPWEFNRVNDARLGPFATRYVRLRETWPCKDGQVCMRIVGGTYGGSIQRLVEWMDSEGMAGNLKQVDWEALNMAKAKQEDIDSYEEIIGRFFAQKTKAELAEQAMQRRLYLLSCNTSQDIVEDGHLTDRDWWTEMEDERLGGCIRFPGSAYKMSEIPRLDRCHPPSVGEHNEEIYAGELGLSRQELLTLRDTKII